MFPIDNIMRISQTLMMRYWAIALGVQWFKSQPTRKTFLTLCIQFLSIAWINKYILKCYLFVICTFVIFLGKAIDIIKYLLLSNWFVW